MTRPTGSPNGPRPSDPFVDSTIADEVVNRYEQFIDEGAEPVVDDLEDESGEDTIPIACTSITEHFAVDPRPPLVAFICKPRGSRQLWLVSKEVDRPDVHRFNIFNAIGRSGKRYLLCVRRPAADGNDFPAWKAMRRLAIRAQHGTTWFGMRWEPRLDGSFKLRGGPCPEVEAPRPTFPDTPREELLMQGFEDRLIEDARDPRLPVIPDLSDAPELT
jgi:hypothetical protein